MSRNRIEIEQAENGHTITVWKYAEKSEEKSCHHDVMYSEPEKFVATSDEEVLKIVKDNL